MYKKQVQLKDQLYFNINYSVTILKEKTNFDKCLHFSTVLEGEIKNT